MRAAMLVAVAALALGACSDEPKITPAPEGGVATAETGPVNVNYDCSDGSHVRVAYGVSGTGQPNVIMDVRGKIPTLVRAADSPTLPGTLYAGDDAWAAGRTGLWVVRGQEATLAERPAGSAGPETKLATCKVVAPKDPD
jgi:hypothetical protein